MGVKILIVDDEPEMERLIRQQFRRKIRNGEYECAFVTNGADALASLQAKPETDVVLCDINMPVMNGLELVAHMAALPHPTKAVMVSAYGNMQNIRSAMNRGAFDFVVKPIDFEDLEITIQKANEAVLKDRQAEETAQKLHSTSQELSESEARESYLREMDELKNRFFTHISHEFRTPLTVILGMAEQIESNPEAWREKGLALIRRNGSNLLDLINQLLDLRKLEAGKLSLNYIQGDIVSYLQYLVNSFESLSEMNDLKISFHSEETKFQMDYDPEKLLRIVTNLLSNAIKFTPQGGEISLQCAVGSMQSKNPSLPTAHCLLLTVSDSGIGIPQEKLPFIFDSFYQAENMASQGTGIGLTLTKELVQLMEGEIHVESEMGKGTAFRIQLPVRQLAEPEAEDSELLPAAPFHLSPSASQRIEVQAQAVENLPSLLLVEDNPDVAQYLLACLEGHYQLGWAQDGQEGIERALEEVPDLIISDVMMPRKSGFELCETLKKDERTSHIPIILLTAKADQEARLEGLQLGADAYLAKPFDKKELFVRLEKLLQLRQKLRERYQSGGTPVTGGAHPQTQKEDAFILKIQQILEVHLTDTDFGIQDLCREVGMSRSQLHNKIKALTGRSTSLYLRFLRLNKAKALLQNHDLNISDVAYQVGFNDPRYFTRSYVQEFGEAPSKRRGG